MKEVAWLVVFLFVAYVVACFLVFLKKKTKKWVERGVTEGRRGEEEGDGKVMAVLFAGIAAYEEGVRVRSKRSKGVVRGRKGEGFSWWRASGRMG